MARILPSTLALALLAAACNQAAPSTVPGVTAAPAGTPGAPSIAATTLPPTVRPPAVTTLAPPVATNTKGRLRVSTVLTAAGEPLPDATLTVTITAMDKTLRTLTLTGVVPLPARSLIVQLGFNNQPDTGPAEYDTRICRITYADGGKSKNRLPNGGFDSGLYKWAVYGEGSVTTPKAEICGGRHLRLRAQPDEQIVMNSYGISVTPGSDFTLTVTAEVPPAGSVSGYAAAIFLKKVEIWRDTIKVVAPEIRPLDAVSAADGAIVLDEALPPGRYLVTFSYPGTDQYLPASIEMEVVVD